MVLQFAFNGCWKVAVTGQPDNQEVVKVFWLPKVSTTCIYFLHIIENCNFSPFLRTCICFISQGQEILLHWNKSICRVYFLSVTKIYPLTHYHPYDAKRVKNWHLSDLLTNFYPSFELWKIVWDCSWLCSISTAIKLRNLRRSTFLLIPSSVTPLTHFQPMFPCYISRKTHQKTRGFLIF